ncbi:TMV resistance protein N-like [Neltuma alba]|uniref:TMV resistance protein N-like n=1 Tax=Neltuma alba TaxID=207710 RepID=UPI0010A43D3A|nr:TMV resistance protein N-like [Prosopis alba]
MATQVETTSSFGSNNKTKYRYDVFLSFRGEDTRRTFTVPFYNALRCKGINAFIDDRKLGKGEEISPTLLRAIERSRISFIVFSRNYATSTWCLEELAHIIWCQKQKNQLVMPIFYKVDPLDVQYQKNSFQEAMAALEDRFRDDLEKVRKWRSALFEAASLSPAWLFEEDGYDEGGFIEGIAEDAYARLPPKRFHDVDYIVGLEPCIEEVMSLLDESDNSVSMLGIHGAGGIGKTTLAKAIYNSIFFYFEGACFLFDVREASKKYQGVVRLQQTLLSEVLEEKKMKFGSVDEGISKIKHRLSHKKILLILDDVEEVEQLEQLAGGADWFVCGSKIIITTRNKQLLVAHDLKKTYEMKELNEHDSLKLFCWHAFRMSHPPKSYKSMSIGVTDYVRGLPLALKLIGSNLRRRKLAEWRYTLQQYNQITGRTIHEILKISCDCLQEGAKRIFLDIAFFFKEENLEYVEDILGACNYGPRFYIEVLVDKSLISVADNGRLHMHDLIQQMAREIVKQEEYGLTHYATWSAADY